MYNLSDVLLLAYVFGNFRNNCMNHYGLDPAWYISTPGLVWDAALKVTKVELALLNDSDMLLMIEVASEEESQQHHTATLRPTTNIWELSWILLRILHSSRI